MHIPDGFLDTKTVIVTAALSAGGVALALRRTRISFPQRRVPLLGLTAAFIFAAQMLNFPVAGGSSGHLMGSLLAAVLLGPGAAVVAMASVLVVQSLVFADGGVLALGANVLNMGITAPVVGYAIYRVVHRLMPGERGQLVAVAFASWCSIVLAAVLCAGELAWSGTVPWQVVFPTMANVHMIIGAVEALITTFVVAALVRVRPDLLAPSALASVALAPAVLGPPARREPRSRYAHLAALGLVVVIALLLLLIPFASRWPDGLQQTAEALGFASKASSTVAPAANYAIPGIGSPVVATMVAGAVGTVVAFGLALVLARALNKAKERLEQNSV